ncbi:hypothetical protein DND132_0640 [Pseudodesulfovibrio mercurii]|uniref:Uncharacterized protein n=1 Tax=Pseudodesulfovibrio mercurii TaxID=641491 RepID=F0JGI7_9BACT|nr:hypothetical protein [Pseudodesulfovibrio mercurii]EGB13856.1 hypothetical protein DND132_0640 [Pseudodesulfovibrio mercurii]
MPIVPDGGSADDKKRRERAARCLTAYAEQLPMPTEDRLELVLQTLRGLPAGAGPEQALDALLSRLPAPDLQVYPPDAPALHRSHMPCQYLGRPRSGLSGFAAQWGWLAMLGLLLALTLILSLSR